jgi:hypothetical protein
MPRTITTEDFDARVQDLGRVRRIDQPGNKYKAAKEPLLFECLQHGERHQAMPTNILRGQGLSCCKAASQKEVAAKKREAARASYSQKLAVVNPTIQAVGDYIDSRTPILHRCLTHGEDHLSTPNNCLAGGGLTCCKREFQQTAGREQFMQIRATAQKIDIAGERHGTLVAVEVGEPYVSPGGHRLTQWWLKCDCGEEILRPLGAFRGGSITNCGKPECKGPSKKRLSQEEFAARIQEHFPDDIARVVTPYVHAHERVEISCPKHSDPEPRLAADISSGKLPCLCSRCAREAANEAQSLTLLEAKQRVDAMHGNAYDLSGVSSYDGQYSKVTLSCSQHGPFKKAWDKLWRGQGCPECGTERGASLIRKPQEKWIEEWREVWGDYYDLSQVQYVNDSTPVRIVCPEHGSFDYRPGHIKRGHGCWHCNQFYGGNLSRRVLLDEPALQGEPAEVYLARWGGFLKPGFTQRKYQLRALQSGYDSKAHAIQTTTAIAWAIEQAVLAETKDEHFDAGAVVRAGLKGKPGWTELRSGLDESVVIARMDQLFAAAVAGGWQTVLPSGIQ